MAPGYYSLFGEGCYPLTPNFQFANVVLVSVKNCTFLDTVTGLKWHFKNNPNLQRLHSERL